jgi:NDP-sugar pyrophosphorylase family protein
MSLRQGQRQIAGILLAGTHAWTNSSFDTLLPRTLLPVAHRPLLAYGLSWLHDEGIVDVAVCGNRETNSLETRLPRHVPVGMSVTYRQDPMPRGAAGSARDAADSMDARTFVVADATTIPTVKLAAIIREHQASRACVTIGVHSEEMRNGNPVIQVPSGIYILERRAFDVVPAYGFCDIKEKLIPELYAAGERVIAYEAEAFTPRVLDASTYMAVNEWMIEQLLGSGRKLDGYGVSGTALVHRDARVAADAVLVGPVLVGPEARIESGAIVLGPTSIGRDVTIAAGATVSRSAIWRRSFVGAEASVDRCIVADDSVVESGNHAFNGVIAARNLTDVDVDWVAQQAMSGVKRPPFDVGAKLARLMFAAGWSRSAAAQ